MDKIDKRHKASDYIELNVDEMEDPYLSYDEKNPPGKYTTENSNGESKKSKFSVNVKNKSGNKDRMIDRDVQSERSSQKGNKLISPDFIEPLALS